MVGANTIDTTYQQEMTVGSEIRFTDFAGTTSDDRIITTFGDFQRCTT